MKRILMTLALMVTIAATAAAMSFSKARKEALFLSDKMAYELSLSLSQYEAVYEINLDYLLGLNTYADVDGVFWLRRNADLRYVLSPWQWDRYCQIPDFYRPMVWVSGRRFSLSLRSRYTNHSFYYYERPSIYGSYRGGHNSGRESYYRGRDFHQPANSGGPQRYGSSSPAPRGSGRPAGNNNRPSYTIGQTGVQPQAAQSGSVRGRSADRGSARSQSTMPAGNTSRTQSTTTSTSSTSSRSTTTTTTSGGGRGTGSTRGNRGGR